MKHRQNITDYQELYVLILADLKISANEIASKSRKREIMDKRTITAYLLHNVIGLSSLHFKALLGIEHSTVLHHCGKCKDLMLYDRRWEFIKELEKKYKRLRKK